MAQVFTTLALFAILALASKKIGFVIIGIILAAVVVFALGWVGFIAILIIGLTVWFLSNI